MASSKAFLLLGLVFAVLLISSEVSAAPTQESAVNYGYNFLDDHEHGHGHGHGHDHRHVHGHGRHGHGHHGKGGPGSAETETEN
ncbi:uncharacterized protein LOC110766645 isoform X3 [Prunus avium]|uniref:Uncharacterized protein LOC110766645 isoform X3 n=1 Tax=Prunus avium TaxID=42229 RepID=A0A6P5TF35_PRUAV|nr:uncharacterized protein LOC110766645 isoform X3 [Prunus avium]